MIDLVRYVVVRGGVPVADGRQWLADQGASNLAIDDAIEDSTQHDLIHEAPDRIEPTLRGQAWLRALKDGPPTRAARLYLDQDRPKRNPARQASFAWAGDPRQLGLFDRATIPAEPEPSFPLTHGPEEYAPGMERPLHPTQGEREAFQAASARGMKRAPKPKRTPKPWVPTFSPTPPLESYYAPDEDYPGTRTKPKHIQKPRKVASPYGAPIVLQPSGEIADKTLRAWAVRWAMQAGVKPALNPNAGMGYGSARDALARWSDAWQRELPREPDDWRRVLKTWRKEKASAEHDLAHSTFEDLLREEWLHLATMGDRALGMADRYHDLPAADRVAFGYIVQAHADLERAGLEARVGDAGHDRHAEAWHERDRLWLALLNRWLDRPWTPPAGRRPDQPNPAPDAPIASIRAKADTAARRQAARSAIRMVHAEQKRARAERSAELEHARDQTRRIRGKVTEASAGRRARIRQRAHERIDRANARIAELRATKAWLSAKAPTRGHGRLWEQNEAVESEVRHLDPLLVPLWRANRGLFRGTPHERFERFLEWADEQGESEVWAAVEKTLPTDRQIAADYEAWALGGGGGL